MTTLATKARSWLIRLGLLMLVLASTLAAQGQEAVDVVSFEALNATNANQLEQVALLGRGMPNDMALSPDGQLLAVSTSVGLWVYQAPFSEAQAQLLTARTADDAVTDIRFSPDGGTLAAVTSDRNNPFRLWDTTTLNERDLSDLRVLEDDFFAFSADGTTLYSGDSDRARGYDLETGQRLDAVFVVRGRMTDIVASADGSQVITSGHQGDIRISDATSGEAITNLSGHNGAVNVLAASPTESLFASGGADGTVRLWDAEAGEAVAVLRASSQGVTDLIFGPDGASLYVGTEAGEVQVWEVASGEITATLPGHDGAVVALALPGDATRLASLGLDGEVRVWDTASGEPALRLGGFFAGMEQVAFNASSDALTLVDAAGTLHYWPFASGQPAQRINVMNSITTMTFSPDGQRLVTGGLDSTVRIWALPDANGGTGRIELLLNLDRHVGPVGVVTYSPFGNEIISVGEDGVIHIWSATDGEWLRTVRGEMRFASDILFSADGQTALIYSRDGRVQTLDLVNNILVNTYRTQFRPTSINPTQLIEAIADRSNVFIYDVSTGDQVGLIRGHTAEVTGVHFSPNNRYVVTTSADGTARVWGVPAD